MFREIGKRIRACDRQDTPEAHVQHREIGVRSVCGALALVSYFYSRNKILGMDVHVCR